MVSIMNELLELRVGHKVLEVGAGSGWHASTVAEIVAPSHLPRERWGHVYTTEIIAELAASAKRNIVRAGYGDRITIIHGDGSMGYMEEAPYDRILVTAASPSVPEPLIQQLKSDGMMIIPIGGFTFFQRLKRIKRVGEKVVEEDLMGVAFVPLRGRYGHRI